MVRYNRINQKEMLILNLRGKATGRRWRATPDMRIGWRVASRVQHSGLVAGSNEVRRMDASLAIAPSSNKAT